MSIKLLPDILPVFVPYLSTFVTIYKTFCTGSDTLLIPVLLADV